jgi:hypothetical protein
MRSKRGLLIGTRSADHIMAGPKWLQQQAEYMTAPDIRGNVRFLLHRGRRPYMALKRRCLYGLLTCRESGPFRTWISQPPQAPGLFLAGFQLVIPDHALGLPVLHTLSLCTCCRHRPGTAAGLTFAQSAQPYQPSPKGLSGRPAHRPFRGLLGVHSRYGLTLALSPYIVTRYPKASAISLPP